MPDRGTVIAISGAKGVYTSALSVVLSELLRWKRVKFSDHLRDLAKGEGEPPDDTAVLQRIGQQLVREQPDKFVAAVLKLADWKPGENLVLDGLRHAEIFTELQRQVGNSVDLHVVHIAIQDRADRADRAKRSEGLSNQEFETYDQDETEKQVEQAPAYASLSLNGADPRGELARTIIRRLLPEFPFKPPPDEHEAVSAMEPLVIETGLEGLARDLIREAGDFAKEVPIGLAQPLSNLVRAMNCYYSNRIEGYNAPLADIDLALSGDYERDSRKRYHQAQAKAHIEVQRWIEDGNLADQPVCSSKFVCAVHDRFLSEFPEPQWLEDGEGSRELVIPGGFRRVFATVGKHVPPSPAAIPRFMNRFEKVYGNLASPESIVLAAAPAHHRLLWIHPFGDGNGRVARLMSDAMLSRALRTHSIWSVSRGLANNEVEYKALIAACDQTRRGDLDGRGNLSESALTEFTEFFLKICLEQVRFMRKRMRLDELSNHIERWVETASAYGEGGNQASGSGQRLDPAAGPLLKAILHEGVLSKSRCQVVVGSKVNASDVIDQLKRDGVVNVHGEAVSFSLPAHRAERFLPGLFP
ncbi:Fic family protein [Bradyrhizobium erythrophlei]|uniref:Fic family protein n=1 Tax=Bradyrhizobium erythrophlei TaxID=1437360 RepID=A0A1M5JW49_9BRAD|nr:Fic family protein [Bradyrhizobium erythrophlei]SHG44510.1 Fic family protein [Bradyrhizobium erythrophlei]